jgi:ribosomal protein L37E
MAGIRCLLGLHDNQKHTNDSGDAYLVCSRCGKESYPTGIAGGGVVPY